MSTETKIRVPVVPSMWMKNADTFAEVKDVFVSNETGETLVKIHELSADAEFREMRYVSTSEWDEPRIWKPIGYLPQVRMAGKNHKVSVSEMKWIYPPSGEKSAKKRKTSGTENELCLEVKRRNPEDCTPLPKKSSEAAAGLDLFSAEDVIVAPRGQAIVDLDLSMKIPHGYYGQIASRSGLASKNCVVSFAGVIDSDYRGPVKVILFNFSDTAYSVAKGHKIAQMLILPVPDIVVKEVDQLDETQRGESGFGSTGK